MDIWRTHKIEETQHRDRQTDTQSGALIKNLLVYFIHMSGHQSILGYFSQFHCTLPVLAQHSVISRIIITKHEGLKRQNTVHRYQFCKDNI